MMNVLPKMKITFLILMMAVITMFSFSAFSQQANAESGNMVGDCIGKKNKTEAEIEACKKNDVPSNVSDSTQSGSQLSVWDYVKVVLALIFVIALLYIVLKLVNRNNKKYQSNQLLQSLGGLSLGQQKSVQLVKVGSSLFVLGVGDDVHILKEIVDEDEQQHLLKLYEDKQVTAAQIPYIAELFNSAKSKFKSKNSNKESDSTSSNDANFKNEFEEKLSKIRNNRQHSLDDWQQKEKDKDE